MTTSPALRAWEHLNLREQKDVIKFLYKRARKLEDREKRQVTSRAYQVVAELLEELVYGDATNGRSS